MPKVTPYIWVVPLLFVVLRPGPACAQLPAEGVIVDDFVYSSATWCSEVNDACSPPAGSVFGVNTWQTSLTGTTTTSRAWYQYLWQEEDATRASTSIQAKPAPDGQLVFSIAPGRYSGDHKDRKPEMIISGFAARRGTWAARVHFGDLEPAHVADLIQAFWILSPILGQATDGTQRSNELDFEWNNRFRGTAPGTHAYLRTGHTVGQRAGGIHSEWPLSGTASPPDPDNLYDWSCLYQWDDEPGEHLDGTECSALLKQAYTDTQGRTPQATPFIVLLIQVADNGITYAVRSEGWGGVLRARTPRRAHVPNLPMAALFSQHMPKASTIHAPEHYVVDWFYYSPSTTLDIDQVQEHVAYVRDTVRAPRLNTTGLSLERPYKHLPGIASTYRPQRTTALDLDFSLNPSAMKPGSTTTLVALPPLRHGYYRYTWRYRRLYTNGSTSPWDDLAPAYGGWEVPFTFPRDSTVTRVQFEVRLEELKSREEPEVIKNSQIYPISRRFFVRRMEDSATEP